MAAIHIIDLARGEPSATIARMMNHRVLLISSLLLAACSEDPSEGAVAAEVEEAAEVQPAAEGAEHLTIDPARSSLGFTGSKVTASHDGSFETFSGTMDLEPDAIEDSRVSITIQMASVQIDPPNLRTHLLSPDFFDGEQFPTATFESTRIAAGGEGGTHTITGNLTLHGVTRSISFPANIEVSDAQVRARAEFSINRQDFGIVYPGAPDNLIRDGVVIRFDVIAPRA
jgi:polyisoprenoid-binding protein YceI